MKIEKLVRPNILRLTPYSCARDEFKGKSANVFLDANENPYTLQPKLNRYPDPLQENLKQEISRVKGVPASHIFLGNGSDEAIDLVYRIFCEPRVDNVVAIAPTYGMYEVSADINDVEYRPVLLDDGFQLTLHLVKTNQFIEQVLTDKWLAAPLAELRYASVFFMTILTNHYSTSLSNCLITLEALICMSPGLLTFIRLGLNIMKSRTNIRASRLHST